MNAPFAATLICLSLPVMPGMAAPAEPASPAGAQQGSVIKAPAPAAGPGQPRSQPPAGATAARRQASEPGLLLAGLVLMAGIALRRYGDGAP